MNRNIRDVMLRHKRKLTTEDFVSIKAAHSHYGPGRVVAYCLECDSVTMEYREGATTVIESLYGVLFDDVDLKISDKTLERRFGHLRQIKKPAKLKPLSASDDESSKPCPVERTFSPPGSAPGPKRMLRAGSRSKSTPSRPPTVKPVPNPKLTASQRRVRKIARRGPPLVAQSLFGNRSIAYT
jgi:hypothetical protein